MRRSLRFRRWLKRIGLAACLLVGIVWAVSLPWSWDYLRKTSVGQEDELAVGLNRGCLLVTRGFVFGPSTPVFGWGFSVTRSVFFLRPSWGPEISHPYPSILRLVIPLWIPFVLVGVPTGFLWWTDRRRISCHCCRKCGYDLTGNMSGICPECGNSACLTSMGGEAALSCARLGTKTRSCKGRYLLLGTLIVVGAGSLAYWLQASGAPLRINAGYVEMYSLAEKPDKDHCGQVIDPQGKAWYRERSPGVCLSDFDPSSAVIRPAPGGTFAVGLSTRDQQASVMLARWSSAHVGQWGGVFVSGKLVLVARIPQLSAGYMEIPTYKNEAEARKVAEIIKKGGWSDREPGN